MLRLGLLMAGSMALAGCGAVEAQLSCTARYAGYIDAWNCIRVKQAVGLGGVAYQDLIAHYVAKGDELAMRVQAGQLTDLQAKNLLDMELVDRKGIGVQRLLQGLQQPPTSIGYYDYYVYFY